MKSEIDRTSDWTCFSTCDMLKLDLALPLANQPSILLSLGEVPMYPSAPDLVGLETVNVLPWNDQATDDIGFDARSEYAESFWLPILGPSTLCLLYTSPSPRDS